ncbi:MAG: cell division protein ZapA [Clostridia bacterium]|nr:cell division protein ZapA [Clostridia bacterium]MBQ2319239.1 cell division protein ZapA [Clostridia bacterium]MBQ2420679.1 cell division protein ZapA [Clostridia bacterium]MBQ5902373.1 cell division protein ZapA [Clostridia bacterium]
MSQKVKIMVGGIDYYINTDEDETYIRGIGAKLNNRLDQLAKQNPYLSTTMVAIFAALECCDEAEKAKKALDSMTGKMQATDAKSIDAIIEVDEARREIERLNMENIRLRKQLAGR